MVLTGRARVLVVIALVAILYGVLGVRWQVAMFGTSLLIWFGFEWLVFRFRIDVTVKTAKARRNVSDHRGPATSLWENQTYDVYTRINMRPGIGLTHVACADRTPETSRLVAGDPTSISALSNVEEFKIEYQLIAERVGKLVFLGVHIQFNDLNGLFSAQRFLHARQELVVYPQVLKLGSLTPKKKRINQLPPPGIHRNVRAGVGSELHEIRDYMPGDPPRSIAWRLSAKRDTLLSKQFENEVPIRCNLMIDASCGVRVGYPNRTTLDSFLQLASSMIETVAASRDPVGLTLFDEDGVQIVPPAANRKSTMRKIQLLADACGRPLGFVPVEPDTFISPGIDLARDLYPHLMPNLELTMGFRIFPLSPWKRRNRALRFQLASVLAAKYETGPDGVGKIMHNDTLLSSYAQRFLAEHQKPYPGPIFNQRGEAVFADPKKLEALSRAILQRLGRDIDNELFVIMADFTGITENLNVLMQAIRRAKARHHRVAVVYAWPQDYAMPKKLELDYHSRASSDLDLQAILKRNERQFYLRNYFGLKHRLSRLEVPLVCSTDKTAPRLLMSQLELVRTGRVA